MVEVYCGKDFPEGFIIEQFNTEGSYHVFCENRNGHFYCVESRENGEWRMVDTPRRSDGVYNTRPYTVIEHGVKSE